MIGNNCEGIEDLKNEWDDEWQKLKNTSPEIEMVPGDSDFNKYSTFYAFIKNYDERKNKTRIDKVPLLYYAILLAELIRSYPNAMICRQCSVKYLLKIESKEREIYKNYDICICVDSVRKIFVDVKGNIDNVQSDLFMALLRQSMDVKECKIIEIVYERENMSKYKTNYGNYKKGEDKKQRTLLEFLKKNKYKYLNDYYYFYGHKEEDESDKREAKKHFDDGITDLRELLNEVLHKKKGVK